MLPLLVFDTNILMDVLLDRETSQATLLVELAEQRRIDLVVPEYVLFEFRGTALRWIRDETLKLDKIRTVVNEWARSGKLDKPAEEIKKAAGEVEARLRNVQSGIDPVISRIRNVAQIPEHTLDIHLRGDLRFLSGRPPDRPVDGLKDCRIYEAILVIAKADQEANRQRFLVTRDGDFDPEELVDELRSLGVTIRKDPGRLYGELLRVASPASLPG